MWVVAVLLYVVWRSCSMCLFKLWAPGPPQVSARPWCIVTCFILRRNTETSPFALSVKVSRDTICCCAARRKQETSCRLRSKIQMIGLWSATRDSDPSPIKHFFTEIGWLWSVADQSVADRSVADRSAHLQFRQGDISYFNTFSQQQDLETRWILITGSFSLFKTTFSQEFKTFLVRWWIFIQIKL